MKSVWVGRGVLRWTTLSGLVACAGAQGHPATSPPIDPSGAWQYEVTASPGARDLSVVATFPPRTDTRMTVVDRADVFVVGVGVKVGDGWREVRRVGSVWDIQPCVRGCTVRYRYLLADGAGAWGDVALGRRDERVIEAPPSTWLLRPEHASAATRLRFHVTTAPGETFVTGVFTAPGSPPGAGVYQAHGDDFMQLPYSAFGDLKLRELANGGATVALIPGAIPEEGTFAWADAALAAVRGFYGRPPVPHVLILVQPVPGDDVGFGSTMGFSGAAIAISVGDGTTKEAFGKDWILVHELVHTALPDLPEEQHWLEEGLATYVEPLARYRQGTLTQADVWGEWALRMKQGEPEAGDEGLDKTHTWGRTYWGGALFCLAADVEIRTRSLGKHSLEDGLRAVLAAGGNISVSWSLERFLAVADEATGTTVLHEMYAKMGKAAAPVDLKAIWRKLGVSMGENGHVHFDDHAELASIRLAMTPPR